MAEYCYRCEKYVETQAFGECPTCGDFVPLDDLDFDNGDECEDAGGR